MKKVTIDRLLACAYVAVFVIINLIVNHCGPWVIPITTVAAVCVNMMIRDFLLYDGGLKWSATTCAAAGAITVLINYEAGMVAIASFVAVVSGALISGCVCIWCGNGFKQPLFRPVPMPDEWEDSKQHAKLGGKSKRTKMIRSLTPRGFARAVFLANDRAINRTTLNRALPD